MRDVCGEDVLEVAAAEDQQPVEAVAAGGAGEALGIGVGLRRPNRGADDADALAADDLVEGGAVLAVAVAEEIARAREEVGDGEVACLLRDPGSSRVGGAAGEKDAAALEFDEEQHVRAAQAERLNGEEVTGDDACGLLPQKCLPARPGPSGAPVPALLRRAGGAPCSATRTSSFSSSPLIRW